jgi:hypothetical protein
LNISAEKKLALVKPSLRAGPEAVGQFQKAAAGEKLPRIGDIDADLNGRLRLTHGWLPDHVALAA